MPLPPLEPNLSVGRRLRAWLVAVPVALLLFLSLLALNLLQTLSLVLLPFSRRVFRAFNRFAANTWWGWCVLAIEGLHGTRLVVTGDDVPEAENAIVVANHQQMTDITVLMALARSKRRLGDLKWFVKKELQWVPGIGWGMWFLDCLFVSRDWTRDRESIEGTFSRLVDGRVPLWLISFVEGTRITPRKLELSHAFAAERGLTAHDHLLLPRVKGFVASVQGLRQHAEAVYDVTIGFVEGVPNLWQWVLGYVERVHVHVRRYPVDTLPDSDQGLADWLHLRFAEKNELLAGYYERGSF